jgi:hypothetical protein
MMVLLPEWSIYVPACFILMTHKTEHLYKAAFRALKGIASDFHYELNPLTISCDFEKGLQNAIIDVFDATFDTGKAKLVGCFFHFVKALIKKAKKLRLIKKDSEANSRIFLLIGLFKIYVHLPKEHREKYFSQIEENFKGFGEKYKAYLNYFKKTWYNNHFLDGLISAYIANSDVKFTRSNNPCELFNHYLGKNLFNLLIIGLIFDCKKPSPGYFIQKLKEIEFCFRDEYLQYCQGKKWNYKVSPLASLQLPYQELLKLTEKILKDHTYDLKSLLKEEKFGKNIQSLISSYVDTIEFTHLKSQREKDKLEAEETDSCEDEDNKDQEEDFPNHEDCVEEEEAIEEEEDEQLENDSDTTILQSVVVNPEDGTTLTISLKIQKKDLTSISY